MTVTNGRSPGGQQSRCGAAASCLVLADSCLPTACLRSPPDEGRISEYLLPQCQQYVGVDLAAACVEACKTRFADVAHARFATTDGLTLTGVDDASVDFAFTWDSLVHADAEVLRSYLSELARVLRPGGAAFVHHSNLLAFVDEATG
jgi:SAM-dependent methyltransferase